MTKEETKETKAEKKEKEKEEKKSEKAAETQETENPVLEKYILDTLMNKYDVVLLARRWAYELQSKEAGLSVSEIISQSLSDILSSKVSAKTVHALPPMRTIKKTKSPIPLTEFPKDSDNSEKSESKKDKE